MAYQTPDGTWWSDDNRYYLAGDEWILAHRENQSQQDATVPTTTAPSMKDLHTLFLLSPDTLISEEPFRQPLEPVYGSLRLTPGCPAIPKMDVDPSIRDAAKRNPMFHACVKAIDYISTGLGGEQFQFTTPEVSQEQSQVATTGSSQEGLKADRGRKGLL